MAAQRSTSEPRIAQPIMIEGIAPQIEAGRYAVKRVVGDTVEVTASAFKDGHDVLAAAVLFRAESDSEWLEARMAPLGDDRFAGQFQVTSNERYFYAVEAWLDRFETWRRDLRRRIE